MIDTPGYEKLKKSVEGNCNEGNSCGCFNPNGCDKENQKVGDKYCSHGYCDKFKWVTDRAAHYAEKTGILPEEILNAWEEKRDYWYMNYYQDGNQPKIEADKVRVFTTTAELLESIGEKQFRCPACDGISTNPYKCTSGKETNGKVCDWKVYGLFGDLGKGIHIFLKEKCAGETIFMPLSWEKVEEV
jgi:hypothetical protein